ncbi:protein-disulfide reductase DsbD [Paraburkholderia phymatum]|uniref:protein-disulfide reductase DsbD n=1 Tax=Paraburkholderia phymatum TaxID=148447 RepID=UPI003171D1C5
MKIAGMLQKLVTRGLFAGAAGFAGFVPIAAHAVDPNTLLSPDKAFALSTSMDRTDSRSLVLDFNIAPGYYLYRDRIAAVDARDGAALKTESEPGEKKADPNFGVVEIYHGAKEARVDIGGARRIRVTWQGCAEAGVCFPPQTREIDVAGRQDAVHANVANENAGNDAVPHVDSAGETPSAQNVGFKSALQSTLGATDASIDNALHHLSPAAAIAVFFALGLAMAFTPCMLPMLPIVTSLVVGARATRGRGFVLCSTFVTAMALVYAGLGLIAALAGHNVQVLLQQWWINTLFAVVLAALALSTFGFYTLQLPGRIRDKLTKGGGSAKPGTVVGAAVSGIFSALLVGPCMTAPLAGTLLYIARSGDIGWGALLLLTLGIGLGIPLLVVGTLGARYMPRPGAWMNRVNVAMGFALLATSLTIIDRVLPEQVALAAWGAWLLAVAATLARASMRSIAAAVLCRSGAAFSGIWGGAALVGALAGATSLFQPLAVFAPSARASHVAGTADELHFTTVRSLPAMQAALADARRKGNGVMVDFTADWCTSCKTIDRTVFTDPKAIDALGSIALIKADVTQPDADAQALMKTFDVVGPPTLVFFDPDGQERRRSRLVGEADTAQLLSALSAGS